MPTFLEVANEWHRRQSPGWTKKHASQVWRSLDIDILPKLGPRPVDQIQPMEIMALIEGIEVSSDIQIYGIRRHPVLRFPSSLHSAGGPRSGA